MLPWLLSIPITPQSQPSQLSVETTALQLGLTRSDRPQMISGPE